jgi:hypothetical protein
LFRFLLFQPLTGKTLGSDWHIALVRQDVESGAEEQ